MTKASNKSQVIVIDEGSSMIKWAIAWAKKGAEGKPGRTVEALSNKDVVVKAGQFPSVVRVGVGYSLDDHGVDEKTYAVEEEHASVNYCVDEISDKDSMVPTNNKEYQYSSANRVLVHEAIRRAGITDGEVTVICTMPIEYFHNNPEMTDKKKVSLMSYVRPLRQRSMPSITKVIVQPEGVCSSRYLYSQGVKGTMVSGDIGGNTTDLTLTDSNGNYSKFKSHNHGTINLAERISQIVVERERLNDKMPITSAMSVLKTGQFQGKDYSMDCKAIIKRFINEAIEMADGISEYRDNLAFVGGGANLIREYSDREDFHIPNEPHMANTYALILNCIAKGGING